MAESTVGTTQGRSTMARKKALNGRFSLRISASHSPSANFQDRRADRVEQRVETESQKTLSSHSAW
jgi:hypothetical protein